MNKDQANSFKIRMADYRWQKYRLEDLIDERNYQFYLLSGVSGVNYEKIPGNANEEAIEQRKLSIIDKIEQIETSITIVRHNLAELDSVLEQMDAASKELFMLKYWEMLTYEEIGEKKYLTPTAIFKRMEKALTKIKYENSIH